DLATIVTALADEMEQYLDRPYALFGDSIGALVSYEVIRELQRRGAPLPVRLFASGMVAPQIVWWDPDAPLHKTADAALFDGLVHDAGMLDAVSLANDELRQVMLPVLR
ncbi:MAG TPA: putative thioesterase, partial [Acidobacteria bacterium]|nr:putative thioesterase [Acidobacteriota bacterium]